MMDIEKLKTCIRSISENTDSDMFLYSSSIDRRNSDIFIKAVRARLVKGSHKKNCILILSTDGGDPDSGYRVIRMIRRYYQRLAVYVFGTCKSTGTLMCLGADEIVMSDFGEFGPLDIQLTKEDELLNTSGLSYLQSLTSLSDQIYKSFEKNFLTILAKSGYSITTKTAAEISSKLAIGLISPISAQVDPIRLGEVHRAITIANAYGDRLCPNDGAIVAKLIVGYPSHGFVIDFEEASTIFKQVRWAKGDELVLEQLLLDEVIREGDDGGIYDLLDLIDQTKEDQNAVGADVPAGQDNGEETSPINDEQNTDQAEIGPLDKPIGPSIVNNMVDRQTSGTLKDYTQGKQQPSKPRSNGSVPFKKEKKK